MSTVRPYPHHTLHLGYLLSYLLLIPVWIFQPALTPHTIFHSYAEALHFPVIPSIDIPERFRIVSSHIHKSLPVSNIPLPSSSILSILRLYFSDFNRQDICPAFLSYYSIVIQTLQFHLSFIFLFLINYHSISHNGIGIDRIVSLSYRIP